MNCFDGASIYLKLGFEHILDLGGYDHILFVVALCAIYKLAQWRQVIILVTAFTIGHSLTLALSTMDIFRMNPDLIETLIPVTILITALSNLRLRGELPDPAHQRIRYFLALFFGLIHGLGFSNYLIALLGKEACITGPLLMFNIGLELGQLIIVAAVLLLSWVVLTVRGVPRKMWNFAVSGLVTFLSIYLLVMKLV
ncbi:HupE/UreJ family protein [Pontibacter sp. G13]|uniref:HupE/UreJ family protein n=1 Tax=Pontibacter sp. G13 TaxID=3074898 RepID=UPI00288BA676|nr:HupE/UreJ family protein [Pontibacter sp. G13]WNJ19394.1 HupE/UreJ family protein [Pontibacter sp. G13]